jgi:hypothetical protein
MILLSFVLAYFFRLLVAEKDRSSAKQAAASPPNSLNSFGPTPSRSTTLAPTMPMRADLLAPLE